VLQGYVDTDYARDLDQQRSTTSYVLTLAECTVSWKTELQDTMELSITEAECMTAIETSKDAL